MEPFVIKGMCEKALTWNLIILLILLVNSDHGGFVLSGCEGKNKLLTDRRYAEPPTQVKQISEEFCG